MKKKNTREKGKLKLSRMFQELKEGDRVAIKRELAEKANFPEILEGRTGVIEGKRGKAYIAKIKVYNQEKRFIIRPVHLVKLK